MDSTKVKVKVNDVDKDSTLKVKAKAKVKDLHHRFPSGLIILELQTRTRRTDGQTDNGGIFRNLF